MCFFAAQKNLFREIATSAARIVYDDLGARRRSFLSAEGIFFAVGGFIRRSHSFDEGGSSGSLGRRTSLIQGVSFNSRIYHDQP